MCFGVVNFKIFHRAGRWRCELLAMPINSLADPRVCRVDWRDTRQPVHTRRCLRCPPGDKMPPWLSSTPFAAAAALLGTGLGFTIQSQLLSQKSPPSQSATQTSASSSRIRRRAPSAWRRPLPIPEFTLVIGAVCDERRHDFRRRLRQLYGPHVAKREMLIKFVVSERYRSDERWLARERARGLPHSAPANDGSATDSAAVPIVGRHRNASPFSRADTLISSHVSRRPAYGGVPIRVS